MIFSFHSPSIWRYLGKLYLCHTKPSPRATEENRSLVQTNIPRHDIQFSRVSGDILGSYIQVELNSKPVETRPPVLCYLQKQLNKQRHLFDNSNLSIFDCWLAEVSKFRNQTSQTKISSSKLIWTSSTFDVLLIRTQQTLSDYWWAQEKSSKVQSDFRLLDFGLDNSSKLFILENDENIHL